MTNKLFCQAALLRRYISRQLPTFNTQPYLLDRYSTVQEILQQQDARQGVISTRALIDSSAVRRYSSVRKSSI
jgi:hypothetical protein